MKLQEKMFALVEAWHQSGITRQEFLTGKAVSLAKFDYWINKHRKNRSIVQSCLPSKPSPDAFKSFVLTDEQRAPAPQSVSLEITTPSGVRITIYN